MKNKMLRFINCSGSARTAGAILLLIIIFLYIIHPASAEILVYEDFDSDAGNFLVDLEDNRGFFLVDGMLVFIGDRVEGTFGKGFWVGDNDLSLSGYFKDYTVSVDVAFADGYEYGAYGLFTSMNGNDYADFDGVVFLINSKGADSYFVGKKVDNQYEVLTDWTASPLISSDMWNRLTVTKIGHEYRFFINGFQAASHVIEDFNGGYLGFHVTNMVDIGYDDFVIESVVDDLSKNVFP